MEQKVVNKGIGWGGNTLKEMLDKKKQLWSDTGCYYGLQELSLSASAPFKLELLHARLLAAVIAGRETTRMISAAPQVREVAELAVALYTPEGDCLLQSTGIIIHITLMGQVVEWMIEQGYEEEGINDGDCFTSNDNAISGLHPPDVYDITPIFWEGELIGWVGTVIMELEIGAVVPGCMPSGATDRFSEGLRLSAEKSAENDKHLKSFERRIRFGSRTPDLLLLNRKGALAANVKVREEVKKAVAEFGIDYYMGATRELVELERRAQLERVKRRTVPGKFHSPTTIEVDLTRTIAPPTHAIGRVTLIPCDFHIKPDGRYFLDFDGTGAWGWHAANTTPSAIQGAVSMILTQTIAYTGNANQGTSLAVDMNVPYDSFVWPSTPNFASGWLFSWPLSGGVKWMTQQSHAFFCRGFVEEFRSGVTTSSGVFGAMTGKDHLGNDFNFLSTEAAGCWGGGAFATRDGVTASAAFMPNVDMGSVEIWELMLPTLWLGRKLLPDSCGWGRYRSGYSALSTFLIYKTPLLAFDTSATFLEDKIYPNIGMFGGYPSQGAFSKLITNANTKELISQEKPLAHGMGNPDQSDLEKNIDGDLTVVTRGGIFVDSLAKDGDVYQCFYGAIASGVGDPIKRDPALARKDLDNGLLGIERCRSMHCIEAKYDQETEEWAVDEGATAELREKRSKERLAKGIPAKEWWEKRRQHLAEGRLPRLLKVMYNESLTKGQRWPGEFRRFWNLPETFTFKED